MWHYIKLAFHPMMQRVKQIKLLVISVLILTLIVGIAWLLDRFQIYLGFLVTTNLPVIGYLAILDAILAMVVYILISRQLSLTMNLLVYALLVYGLFSVSGTGLPWTFAVINLVVVVLAPWLLDYFKRWKWIVATTITMVLLITFIVANAPGQSFIMGFIYFLPTIVLWSLAFRLPEQAIHDGLTAVTLMYPAIFVGIIALLINPNGDTHYQHVMVDDHDYLITQETTSFIDQVYVLKVYQSIGFGFYHEIYVYSEEWQVGLWTMQDATLLYEDSTFTITLVSPDESEQYRDEFTLAD